jgi:hypothetical protein
MNLWTIHDEARLQEMHRRWEMQYRWMVWIYGDHNGGYQGA